MSPRGGRSAPRISTSIPPGFRVRGSRTSRASTGASRVSSRRSTASATRTPKCMTADGASYVLKVSAAGESEGAVDFQVAALRHLERHAPDLPVPRIIASRAGTDLEWIAAADGARHMVRLLELDPGHAALARRAAAAHGTPQRGRLSGAARARPAGPLPSPRPALRRLGHPARAAAGARRAGLGGGRCEGVVRGFQRTPAARGAAAPARAARAGRARRRARR